MTEDFTLTEEDYMITEVTLGPNICFSKRVEDKLDFDWQCAGPWQIIDLPNDFYIVKVVLQEDMDYALCSGPWIIAGQTLVVQKWRANFNLVKERISRMAVWARINDIPVKYYEEYTMSKIASMIGPVIKVDKLTLAQARGKFCRVCVEIDLDAPLKPFVEIYGAAFGVVYEGINTICFNCGCYGHVREKCQVVEHTVKQVDGTISARPMNNEANPTSSEVDTITPPTSENNTPTYAKNSNAGP
ncbi:uncharacterized protein LOC112199527 [Rosa chinensis]|uniref:uncharacterized protein LOC112199527 n=1 Tax=Rosa chinensis TaxID=74649 RepID=UPI000D08CD78|nr:uncharacterized protein LOC112199527 [Rosa chinensis]